MNECRHLAEEGLANLMETMGFKLGSSELHTSVLPTTLWTHPLLKIKKYFVNEEKNNYHYSSMTLIRFSISSASYLRRLCCENN